MSKAKLKPASLRLHGSIPLHSQAKKKLQNVEACSQPQTAFAREWLEISLTDSQTDLQQRLICDKLTY